MDGWQAIQSWAIFTTAAVGLGLYYWPKQKPEKTTPPQKESKETKKDVRKPNRPRQENEKSSGAPSISLDSATEHDQASLKKRKGPARPGQQPTYAEVVDNDDQKDDIDMSTRQFAANMQKAREGVQVKAPNKNDARVKTVKAKNSAANTPILSSGSSQADVEEDWTSAKSPALKAGGIDDMLEPVAAGPSALRITASEKPIKDKVDKQPKKEVVETKKQRQNRKKAEERKQALVEEEQERKARAELQRRAAREARGEPAKNGIAVAPAPVKNPWAEQNASRDAHLPAVDNTGNTVQLLDTLDTESNSSSNQGTSTAATSVADANPRRWAEDNDYAKAVEESERDSGWSEVKSTKKTKKNTSESNGTATPVAAPVAVTQAKPVPSTTKPVGFQALHDEGERSEDVDSSDPSNWAA